MEEPTVMKTHLTARKNPARERGFSLLCSLILMVLLSVLAVGLLSLSTISLRTSQASQARQEAMANARLALQLAIGELQKYAGPDQRVTARAEIQEQPGGSNNTLKQPWLTGVWKTEDHPQSSKWGRDLRLKRPQKLPAYLISGNERFDLTSTNPATGNYPQGYVTPEQSLPSGTGDLPGEVEVAHSPHAGKRQSVRAPRITVDGSSGTQGGYAYWVEDEGVKARLDLSHPFDEATDKVETYAAGALGHRNRVDWIARGDGSGTSPGHTLTDLPEAGNDPLWGKLVSMHTVAFSGRDPQAASEDLQLLGSDLTTSSRSLLVDMQRGGFRRDLTAAFRGTNLQAMVKQKVFDTELVFPQQGAPADGETGRELSLRPGGVPWSVLKDYADYANRVTSKSQVLDLRNWLGQNANTPDVTGRELTAASQFYPVLNRIQMFFDVSFQDLGGDRYDLMFHLFPMLVLWNPYDQPMRIPPFKVVMMANKTAATSQNNFTSFQLAFNYELKGNYQYVGSNPGNIEFKPLSFYSSKPLVLPPGKSTILTTPKKHVAFNTNGAGQELVSEWQDGFGLYKKAATVTFKGSSTPSIKLTRRDVDGDTATNNDFGGEMRIASSELAFNLGAAQWDLDDAADKLGNFIPEIRPAAAPLMGPSTPRWGGILTRKLIENQLDGLATNPNEGNACPVKGVGSYNLRAHHYNYVGTALNTPPQFITGTLRAGTDIASYAKPQIANPGQSGGPHYTFLGGSDLAGADRNIMFHIPCNQEPVLSLAQFSHASLVRPFNEANHKGSSNGEDLEPTYPVGNSLRPAHHPADQLRVFTGTKWDWTTQYYGGKPEPTSVYRADTSFLYNNALWDSYYLSGYDPKKEKFLNARLKQGNEDRETKTALGDPLKALSEVYLDGGFNVNSTSKAAWKALLASTVGIRDTADGKPADQPAYNRLPQTDTAFRPISGGMTATSADPYLNGARMLDEKSLDQLAEQIVQQVKLRGPFPTLAAFVNRSLDPASHVRGGLTQDQVCNQGALQAAIDGMSADGSGDVNQTLSRSHWVKASALNPSSKPYSSSQVGCIYPKAAEGARGFGAPLYLMPSDILAKIGPFLTVRSDTFRVHAYGESRDESGKLLARVRCEAIVQRDPQWVGDRLAATEQPEESSVEARFGRCLRVVSFRWVNENEA